MRIEILTSVAGINFSYGPGERDIGPGEDQISERDAFELLRDGIARIVKSDEVETATTAAPEAAVTRGRGRPRGSGNRAKPDAA
jgi:hypothetical protein